MTTHVLRMAIDEPDYDNVEEVVCDGIPSQTEIEEAAEAWVRGDEWTHDRSTIHLKWTVEGDDGVAVDHGTHTVSPELS